MGIVMTIAKVLRHTASTVALALVVGTVAGTATPFVVTEASAAVVGRVVVQGNRRVDADTIRGFLTISPGENFGPGDIDASIRQLFNTGLFADVRIRQEGNALVVDVIEQAIVNQVLFIGNDKVKDDQLAAVTQTNPRGAFDPGLIAGDETAIRESYERIGRTVNVTSDVETIDDGRVNVTFRINEGDRTGIRRIEFVGNDAFGDTRLRNVIETKKSNFLSFLNRRDVYDEDRFAADEERLRRFYFNRGYADFQIVSTVADLDPVENEYTITVTVDEGQKYRFGQINIDSTVPGLDTELLRRRVKTRPGDVYDASDIEDSLISLSEEVANRGFAFADVTPRGDRNFTDNTINVDYVIDEGPRVFIERIEVRGNTRTRDYVIRREFDVSEGDAFNRIQIQKARRRLEDLGFFETVDIRTVPGRDPDRVVVVVQVEDKSTGEFGIGAGFQTAGGGESGRPKFDLSVTERNLLGRGQFIRASIAGSTDDRTYSLSFTEPYFLGRRLAAGFDLARSTAQYSSYDVQSRSAALRLSAPLSDNLRATAFYAYRDEEYDITDPSAVSGALLLDDRLENRYVSSSLGYSLTYDSIDNRQDPRSGLFAEFRQEFAGVGGDANWLKTTARARYYKTLNEEYDIVGLIRGGGGNITALGDDTLRTFDHFVIGPSRLRGFESRGIGPRDGAAGLSGTGRSLGGTNYVNASVETTFPIPVLPREFGLRGAVFADAASIWDYEGPLGTGPNAITVIDNEFEVRASVGVSLLWASPFGPLRLDYAEPVRKLDGDVVQNFNFGISSQF